MDDNEQVSRRTAVYTCVTGTGDPDPHAFVDSFRYVQIDMGICGDSSVTAAAGTLLRRGFPLSAAFRTVGYGYHVPEGGPPYHLHLTRSTALRTGCDLSVLSSRSLTVLTDDGVGDIELYFLALQDILECDLDVIPEGVSLLRGIAGPG